MRLCLSFAALMLLATSGFAQSKATTDSTRPVFERPPQTQSRPQQNFHARSRFGDTCCFSSGFAQTASSDSGSLPASYGVVAAQGGPNWQSSNFVTFSEAVAMGQQHPTLAPTPEAKSALIQQMLDLIQQVRVAENQNRLEGNSGPVKWGDLKPAVNPADYQRPPSTYLDFSQALALGQREAEQKQEPAPSLGEVAQDERAAKPAGEKAAVVIKQDAHGNPIIVHKQP
jgi:hypothetical protein